MLGSPSLCAGLEELERCLFAERLAVVAAGPPPRDKAKGQWWMAAQWAPYQREDEPVQSCILVQTRFRGEKDGVPVSSTLKGEPGVALGGFLLPHGWNIPVHRPPGLGMGTVPTGFVECGFALPAYVTWQLETLEQEEQECLKVTDTVVACPLPCVLPTALGVPCSGALLGPVPPARLL